MGDNKQAATYILTNKPYGLLYTGVTSNLQCRTYMHRQGLVDGFSKKYNTKRLVYFEIHDQIYEAITREKQIKHWKRDWKIKLIERKNPKWQDLYHYIL